MSVETVTFIKPLEAIEFGSGISATGTKETGNFATWFDSQLNELNEQIKTSEVELRRLATGETNNIHHVMLSLEKAKTSFQLMMQVRNKAMEAYQDMMRMQL
ncbi:flagellar hook-basal body complex protein FliE [Candidatus Thiodiazotropha sp. CDECU1]|uniref:flagellar hook-basal body complex protein FliE n=1 Tax=Candidatus Thiodiazotropha sp. CDECU1 TaxID=3065865 RepID=UPI0029310E0D|nr:flagellar hook-basal body complex protein FliE [Candidatus Thiodiazotropha sp. CDECU1]